MTRNIVDAASGKAVPVEETLEITVKPGWKEGTRVTFAGAAPFVPVWDPPARLPLRTALGKHWLPGVHAH